MKRIIWLTLVSLLFVFAAVAQEEEPKKGFDKEKLFIGGSFGLSFGDYTIINVSPQLGYRFNQYLAAGMGINMQYVSVKERNDGTVVHKTSQGVAGLNMFGRVYPIRQIMLQVQPELNYLWGKQKFYIPPEIETKMDTKIVPSLLLGGGAVFSAGRGSFIASIFYDVLNNDDSPYSNRAIINFGYNIGLY